MLKHGGNLIQAKQRYPDVKEPWLDLSTGISPWVWPVPDVPVEQWQRLPERSAAFDQAVASYYGVADLIPVAGSQTAIEVLPQLFSQSCVALPLWGYGEHLKSWQKAGHRVMFYNSYEALIELLPKVDHAVVINPNNPTGELLNIEQLIAVQQQVSGYLLVDEAFIDGVAHSHSLLMAQQHENCIVLRSMGKFFGLAGIRLGFVSLPLNLREAFTQRMTLWSISAPSLWIAEQALVDGDWQQAQRQRIERMSKNIQGILTAACDDLSFSSGLLFVSTYARLERLQPLFEACTAKGIWSRIYQNPNDKAMTYWRLGLPQQTQRLESVLEQI